MTITATADPDFEPPRVQVDISVPVGDEMTAVAVFRNDSFGRSLLRSQPTVGFDSRTVFDYECPYGQSVSYDWVGQYADLSELAETFSEPFSSWPGSWSGDTGSGSVDEIVLTLTAAPLATRAVSRTGLDVQADVFTVGRFLADPLGFLRFTFDSGYFDVLGGEPVSIRDSSGTTATTIDANPEAFTITRLGSLWRVEGTGGSTDLSLDVSGALTGITVQIESDDMFVGAVMEVGAITVDAYGELVDVAETSSPVTLTPTDAWLIAPQAPALSVPLSNTNQQAAGIRTLGPIGNATNTTVHRILGTSIPVTTTTGNRQGDVLAATIYTHTSDERVALKALLNPDTPILINVPPAWELDLTYGFYQVGDVLEQRPYTLGGIPMRDFTLPLTRVRSPEVDVENPGWSYAQLASTWATYTDVLSNYATYADLTVDERV